MTTTGPGQGSVLDVGTLLADRMLTVTGTDDASSCAARVDRNTGGLVVTGSKAVGLPGLIAAYPGLVVFREPTFALAYTATAAEPFCLSGPDEGADLFSLDEDLFPKPDLNQVLSDQRASGASATITPTGFIPPGAADAMKSAVEQANLLDRNDVLLWLPCSWKWVQEPSVTQLIAICQRSRHPVALSLADPQDPLEHTGAPLGFRRVCAEVPGLVLWRTDLAGIDGLANGANAAAIGMLASTRHITEPGRPGFSNKPNDLTPRILLPDLLRYVQTTRMRDDWFASTPAPDCWCDICSGRPIDRFDRSTASRLEGHLHNLVELTNLHSQLLQAGRGRDLWWRARLHDARAAHQSLESRVSVKIPFPKVLDAWSRN